MDQPVPPLGLGPGKSPPRQRRLEVFARLQEQVAPQVAAPARRFTVATHNSQTLVGATHFERAVVSVLEPLQRRLGARF